MRGLRKAMRTNPTMAASGAARATKPKTKIVAAKETPMPITTRMATRARSSERSIPESLVRVKTATSWALRAHKKVRAQCPGANGTLWVTNRTGALGSVTVFDAGTGAVIDTVTVGSKPTGVLAPDGADKAYVSNGSPSNSVSVIAKDTLSVIATIDTGAGSDPIT